MDCGPESDISSIPVSLLAVPDIFVFRSETVLASELAT